ncbi:MAG: SDR family oxidoreductase [Proteobacteria bacterium]|nr:SDR family oxidoreductase [Pseudomonadota bacterium]MBI3497798.1 SDR family oxidoreductase [Pseudomonadota bacterium]
MRLKGKIAVVTGAASGIGRAVAERFASEGAKVMLADVKAKEGRAAARAIGRGAKFVLCDVGDKKAVDRLIQATARAFGAIDIMVANAGIVHSGDFLELAEADWDKVIRVNLKGVFLASQAAARQMVRQIAKGRAPGSIITMSSVNAVLAIPSIPAYVAAKGGVNQLTKAMALALAPHGIRVNAIGPGTILTELAQAVLTDDAARKRILSRTPLGRLGTGDEVASVAVFLASQDASYITGQTIYPDGGRLALNYTVAVPD